MPLDPIFLLRLIVTPLLVGAMSLVARRFGPTMAGILMGIPWMTAPVLYFLAVDKGAPWAVGATTGVVFAVLGIAAFIWTYAMLARRCNWAVCLAAAAITYAAGSLAARELLPTIEIAAAAGAVSLIVAYLAAPRPQTMVGARGLPWWDIPVRMLATACLVAFIMVGADSFGPTLSGIIASFPVITTVVASFTHYRWGSEAVILVLRGLLLSLLSFVGFFLMLGWTLVPLGIAPAFACAVLVSIFGSIAVTFGLRRVI